MAQTHSWIGWKLKGQLAAMAPECRLHLTQRIERGQQEVAATTRGIKHTNSLESVEQSAQ